MTDPKPTDHDPIIPVPLSTLIQALRHLSVTDLVSDGVAEEIEHAIRSHINMLEEDVLK